MSEDIANRVRAIIAEHLGLDLSKVIDEARLVEDLGADSLDQWELRIAIENECSAYIDEEIGMDVRAIDVINMVLRERGIIS